MTIVDPIHPTDSVVRRNEAIVRYGGWAARFLAGSLLERVDVRGGEHLQNGPLLVLMNHTNLLDPILLTLHARRPIQFLITEPAMNNGLYGRLTSWWGQIPKRKLDPDTRSMRLLKAWCQRGGVVGLFPEGQFTWDGQPLPIRAGLQQLVSYLQVPVVTVRLINGDRLWPPWAKYPRRTRLRFEIDPPKRFERGEPVERTVAERLHVDPDRCDRWPAHGPALALGLAKLLRFCPRCGVDGELDDRRSSLACGSCGSHWTVTGDNRLEGDARAMTITQALREAEGHWRNQWERDGHHRSRGLVDVLDVSRREPKLVATGALRLERTRLRVGDWELAMNELLAHMLDWDDRIVLRTERQRLALRMPADSRALWSLAFDETLVARGAVGGPSLRSG